MSLMQTARAQKRAVAARQRATDAALAYAYRQVRGEADAAVAELAHNMTVARQQGVTVDVAWLVASGRLLRVQAVTGRAVAQYAAFAHTRTVQEVAAARQMAQADSRALVEAAVPEKVRNPWR